MSVQPNTRRWSPPTCATRLRSETAIGQVAVGVFVISLLIVFANSILTLLGY
jgi:hypothetical protein